MSLYVIGDLHLSFGAPDKSMEAFGGRWQDYETKIRRGFGFLSEEDVCVICGDFCWAENLSEALLDFQFLHSLPGRKIFVKGNHDFWWTTKTKLTSFFKVNGFQDMDILHNGSLLFNGLSLCGSRGWFWEEESGKEHDRKVYYREVGRLRRSLQDAQSDQRIVFLHYPPICGQYRCGEIIELMKEFSVSECYFGHLHGKACASAPEGTIDGIKYRLISSDHLDFIPYKII